MSTERPDDARPVDDAVDQAWRTVSHEEPGPRLDAAILAAARVQAERARDLAAAAREPARQAPGRKRDWWTSWQPLAAAATIAGLAFVLVQTIPRDRDVAPPIAVESPGPGTAARESAAEAAAPGTQDAAAEAQDAAALLQSAESRRRSEPQVRVAPTPPPPAATMPSPPPETPASAAAEAPAGIAAQAEREFGVSQRATKSAADSLAPEAWAARIGDLFDSGDRAAAAEELRAFRTAHADADRYLPEALREWAAAVE